VTAVNPWEERARAIKAYKMARVVVRAVRETGLPFVKVENATIRERLKVAELAGVSPSSDVTWEMMLGIASEMLAQLAQERAKPPTRDPSEVRTT